MTSSASWQLSLVARRQNPVDVFGLQQICSDEDIHRILSLVARRQNPVDVFVRTDLLKPEVLVLS